MEVPKLLRHLAIVMLLCLLPFIQGKEECILWANCFPPDCMCASSTTPVAEGTPAATPQLVVLSFDDAVTITNFDFYMNLGKFKNPNGCGISMTFFVSHTYTNYTMVNELQRNGHEIAVHSVSHYPDVENYWRPANYSVWEREIVDMRDMAVKYGALSADSITGFRAPFLEIGGDTMYKVLSDYKFGYDCSWVTQEFTNWFKNGSALFPYTMDYPSPQDCPVGTCPKDEYPGFWVTPMLDLLDNRGEPCAMLDACQGNLTDCAQQICEDNVYQFLLRNFEMNYLSNRAPFGLYTHHSWFLIDQINNSTAHTNGYLRFLQYVTGLEDVYVVSVDRLLKWMKSPVNVDEVENFLPFGCPGFPPDSSCPDKKDCSYEDVENIGDVTMSICGVLCPTNFPWLGNVDGN